jgi:hypothetical protein
MFGLRSRFGITRETFKKASEGKDFEEVFSHIVISHLTHRQVLNMSEVANYIASGFLLLDREKLVGTREGLKILDTILTNITSTR